MGRKNSVARARNAKGRLNRRERDGGRPISKVHSIPRAPVEELIVPDGQCLRNPRKPKAMFATEDKARRALRQAQTQRARMGARHVEKRYYPCPLEEGGCGGFHLTSRESYDADAWKRKNQ